MDVCCGDFCYLILRTRDEFSSLVSHSLCQWSWAPQHLPSFYISVFVLIFDSEYLKWRKCKRCPNASFLILKFYYVKLTKGPSSQSYGSTSSHVWMWELDDKGNWAPKNWCFWTVVLEKTLESPREIQPVHPKGDQSWIFIGRTDAEAETPILWPPDAKNWLI